MKTAIITGGNKGIGFEVTKQLLGKGYRVIVLCRDTEPICNWMRENDYEYQLLLTNGTKSLIPDHRVQAETIDELKDVLANFHPEEEKKEEDVIIDEIKQEDVNYIINFDIAQVNKISKLVDELTQRVGSIDVLVNNAGIMNSLPITAYSKKKQDNLMNINLYAPIELIRGLLPHMIENGGGRIVSTASIAGEIGHPDIWYGISKAGIINVTKSIAKSFAKSKILINTVAPGPVETDMLEVIPNDRKESLKGSTFLNRFAKPEEVAQAIVWLADESPEYINGMTIDFNNGAFPR